MTYNHELSRSRPPIVLIIISEFYSIFLNIIIYFYIKFIVIIINNCSIYDIEYELI